MPTNSDLKRWYKVYNVEQRDFVRYDSMFRVFCYDATDDFHAVNLGQMNNAIKKAIQSHAYDVKVNKINFPYGELSGLTYDTTDGIIMRGQTRLTELDDETLDIPTSWGVPLKAGKGINIDVSENGKHIEVKNDLNLENGTGASSVQQKYVENGVDYSAQATGKNAVAFGGKRYDMLTDADRTPTSAEGNQSFAAGGSTHAIGDFSATFGKDSVARQRATFASGSSKAGMTEEEFNSFFWDSTNNKGKHGGSKDSNGNILDFTGAKYANSFAFSAALGCDCIASAPRSFAAGDNAKATNTGAIALGGRAIASGANAFAANSDVTASGDNATAFGGLGTRASDAGSFAIGFNNEATGRCSFAGGLFETRASGKASFAFGEHVWAMDANNVAAIGSYLESKSYGQFSCCYYNLWNPDYLFMVGNGDSSQRKNAFVVMKDGRAKVQSPPIEADDVVRKKELDTKLTKDNTTTSMYPRVYGVSSIGNQSMYKMSTSSIELAIVYRDSYGRAQINDPVSAKDIANKQWTEAQIAAAHASVYTYKGSKDTYANLPATGNNVGDVWNVEDTGINYGWNGTDWDSLSANVLDSTGDSAIQAMSQKATTDELNKRPKVVANPTLAGTEADLTGLQVGDTKYKMPASGGGKLYRHILSCNIKDGLTEVTGQGDVIVYNRSIDNIKRFYDNEDYTSFMAALSFSVLNITQINETEGEPPVHGLMYLPSQQNQGYPGSTDFVGCLEYMGGKFYRGSGIFYLTPTSESVTEV